MLVPTRIRFGITLPAGLGPRVGAVTPARSTLGAVIDGNGLDNRILDSIYTHNPRCVRSVYGRGRQMCGVGGGGRAGAIDDIGPIKSDRPPPSSEAPPVTEIIQHRGEHASRR
jgi:hypothetical protein